jgi:hypothetical protein
MPYTSHPFAHRTNPDDTIDSICKTCFVTVGTALEDEALKALEADHICDPWRLEVLRILVPERPLTSLDERQPPDLTARPIPLSRHIQEN